MLHGGVTRSSPSIDISTILKNFTDGASANSIATVLQRLLSFWYNWEHLMGYWALSHRSSCLLPREMYDSLEFALRTLCASIASQRSVQLTSCRHCFFCRHHSNCFSGLFVIYFVLCPINLDYYPHSTMAVSQHHAEPELIIPE